MNNPLKRNPEVNPANPFGGWPNPGEIKGSLPSRPIYAPQQGPKTNGLWQTGDEEISSHPLVICIGGTAEEAGRFTVEQLLKDQKQNQPGCSVLFLGGKEANLFSQNNWQKRIAPQEPLVSRKEYAEWFADNIRQISINMQEMMNSLSHIFILTHLDDAESAVLGSLLYLLRTFSAGKQVSISLIVSPTNGSDDTQTNIPGLKRNSDPISSMLEVTRYAWPGFYQQDRLPLDLRKLASDRRLVDYEFWIKSATGGKQSDCEQMAEFLSILLCQSAESFIDQQLINGSTKSILVSETTGIPMIIEVRCASLYLPISEHKNYLQACMINELLCGNGGVFIEIQNTTEEKTLLDRFCTFQEYQHPLFYWMFSDGNIGLAGDWPIILDIDSYVKFFKLHLVAFINQQFLAGFPFTVIEGFLNQLQTRIQHRKRTFLQENQTNLYKMVGDFEKFVFSTKCGFTNWSERIFTPQSVDDQFVPVGQQIQQKSDNLQKIISENIQNCLVILQRLTQRLYSVPAIDGDIANDETLLGEISTKIKTDHLRDPIGWWLVEINQQPTLLLFIGDKSFTSEKIDQTFWSTIGDQLVVPIADLMRIDNNEFQASIKKCVQKLTIINKPGLNPEDGSSVEQKRILFSNSEQPGKMYASQIFNTNLGEVQNFGNLDYAKFTAMILDVGLQLNVISLFKENLKEYLTNKQNGHIEQAEHFAREIEKALYPLFNELRLFTPDIVFCLHEEARTKLFFKAFLAGLIHSAPNRNHPGEVWCTDPIDCYAGVELFAGNEQMKKLDSLYGAFHQFTIGLLPQKVVNQNTSPFHNFNWEKYKTCIVNTILAKSTKKAMIQAIIPIFTDYGIACTESKLRTNPEAWFQQLFNTLAAASQFRELDMARLIYYHMNLEND
ncbi:MAG: hypothetical protein AB9897_05390 [Anaerolineaceae bacterium]